MITSVLHHKRKIILTWSRLFPSTSFSSAKGHLYAILYCSARSTLTFTRNGCIGLKASTGNEGQEKKKNKPLQCYYKPTTQLHNVRGQTDTDCAFWLPWMPYGDMLQGFWLHILQNGSSLWGLSQSTLNPMERFPIISRSCKSGHGAVCNT